MSAEIEAAVLGGRLLFATDADLIAVWAKHAEEMLLRPWRPRGFEVIRDVLWRNWHLAKAEELDEELASEAARNCREHVLLTTAALRFDGFAEAALQAGVFAFLEEKQP
ncbi:MAG TPA: hypothetical protein VNF74_07515 [Terriglobales bacterium]|nr:hypothetical protein [Terriglobales bacterium]